MAMTGKMRHCWNCGAEMGLIGDACFDRLDTCGKRECERAASLVRDEDHAAQQASTELDELLRGGI